MPIIRNYKPGSIVYFEKDRADDIYVLQSGRIILNYTSVDGRSEMKEDVKIGEFFGVKSSLGRYPREETAQVLGNASVLVFKLSEFETLVGTKTHLILKMMKVFSNQLRQIHHKVREELGQFGDAKSPSYELMNVAEVFHKNGNFNHASYAYNRYLIHYPAGNYAERAKELLALSTNASMYPTNLGELVYEPERKNNPVVGGGAPAAASGPVNPYAQAAGSSPLQTSLDNAKSKLNSGDHEGALGIFKTIIGTQGNSTTDNAIIEEAFYHAGVCMKETNKIDEAYAQFSNYVKKYPKGERVKQSILNLAGVSEQKGEKDKAITLYNKVAALPPEDEFSEQAKSKIEELKG